MPVIVLNRVLIEVLKQIKLIWVEGIRIQAALIIPLDEMNALLLQVPIQLPAELAPTAEAPKNEGISTNEAFSS